MIIPIKETLMRFFNKRIAKKNMLERVNPSFSSSRKIGVVFSWEGEEKKEGFNILSVSTFHQR